MGSYWKKKTIALLLKKRFTGKNGKKDVFFEVDLEYLIELYKKYNKLLFLVEGMQIPKVEKLVLSLIKLKGKKGIYNAYHRSELNIETWFKTDKNVSSF